MGEGADLSSRDISAMWEQARSVVSQHAGLIALIAVLAIILGVSWGCLCVAKRAGHVHVSRQRGPRPRRGLCAVGALPPPGIPCSCGRWSFG